jgi:1,4-alpha-glucan branching enzyme
MGGEFGQSSEWDFSKSLDWHLLQYAPHKGLQEFFKDLNTFYKSTPALYEKAFSQEGFEWINYGDHENSVISFIRKGHDQINDIIVVCNFTSVVREGYKIGLPRKGSLKQVLNSDSKKYFGSGIGNPGKIKVVKKERDGKPYSADITLSPLGIAIFQYE